MTNFNSTHPTSAQKTWLPSSFDLANTKGAASRFPGGRLSLLLRVAVGSLVLVGIAASSNLAIAQATRRLAATDVFVTLPGKGRDVLTITTELSNTSSGAVGSAVVTVASAAGPSQSDRDLEIAFYIRSYGDSSPFGRVIRRMVRLPEGRRSVVVEIPFVSDNQYSFDVVATEGRRNIEDKTNAKQRARNNLDFSIVNGNAFALSTVILNSQSEAYAAVSSGEYRSLELRLWGNSVSGRSISLVGLEKMVTDWRSLTDSPSVVIASPVLARMIETQPAKAQVLRDYVAAGGTLILHSEAGVEAEQTLASWMPEQHSRFQWEYMNVPAQAWWNRGSYEVSQPTPANSSNGAKFIARGPNPGTQQLRLADSSVVIVSDADASAILGAQSVTPGMLESATTSGASSDDELQQLDTRGVVHDAIVSAESVLAYKGMSAVQLLNDSWSLLDEDSQFSTSLGMQTTMEAKLSDARNRVFQSLSSAPVRRARVHAGQIVVMPRSPVEMGASFDGTMRSLMTGGLQTQLAREVDGDWGYRNLIRVVGKPPVWTFCIAVALFGLLLGPGLLFLTARLGRRSLMLFFVPVVSLFATVSIIAYGVVHEGFGTHIRSSSVQWIDAKTNAGFAWSRQNYFSGVPSRDGLILERDTYARAVQLPDASRSYTMDPTQDVAAEIFLADQQIWRRWLRPRNQQQMLIGHALDGVKYPLVVERVSQKAIRFSNIADVEVKLAVTRDENELHYVCQELLPGQSIVVDGDEKAKVLSQVSRLWVDLRPMPPLELQGGGGSLLRFGRRRISTGSSESDVLNITYRQYMSDKAVLPIGTVAAVVASTDNLQIPIEGEEEESVHLLIGDNVW